MADYTPRLQLLRQYLEDEADKRSENRNWDIIDLLFHPDDGHIHDGEDSPEVYMDLTEVWKAIDELYKLYQTLRADHTRLDYFVNQFYLDYSRHNHSGVETIFTETFSDLENTRQGASTMVVNPQFRFLTLPENYQRNKRYTWVGRVFNLNQDPDPEVSPSSAESRIIMTRRGDITPYLTVGDGIGLQNGRYPGAVQGSLQEIVAAETTSSQVYSFAGKGNDLKRRTNHVPHRAWHWRGIGEPPLSKFNTRWAERKEFTPAQYYRSFTKKDPEGGRESVLERESMITSDLPFEDAENTYEEITSTVKARPLFSGVNILSWERESNNFYWLDEDSGNFEAIADSDLGPIPQENMVEVAACEDDRENIYVLKSWVEQSETPQGSFDLKHQIIKWNREHNEEESFEEGNVWIAANLPRIHWVPSVIAPTHLEIQGEKLYIYTELSWQYRREIGTGEAVNYYVNQDNYPWFPFGKFYGNLHKQVSYVTMLYFDPAIMGTLKTMSLDTNTKWVPLGHTTVIEGQFPLGNSWSTYSREAIKDFSGGNDNVYLGMRDDIMVFYQSFVPYDGDDILNRDIWQDDNWLNQNLDKAWHGLIKYNVKTGERETIIGDIPFRVNAAGALFEDEAHLMDGIELVKQWVVEDEASGNDVSGAAGTKSILASATSTINTNKKILGSFWVSRASARAKVVTNRGGMYASASSSIRVNTSNGNVRAVASSSAKATASGGRVTASARASVSTTGGGGRAKANARAVIRTGGKQQSRPQKNRPSRKDPPQNRNVKERNGIVNGERACMLFMFAVGEIDENDTIKVHFNAASRGVYPSGEGVPFENAEFQAVEMLAWQQPGWAFVKRPRADNNEDHVSTISPGAGLRDNSPVYLWLRSMRRSDRQRRVISRLLLNYIYITVERQGYVYKYVWPELPQGTEAAMMIDARSQQRDIGISANEQQGMEILGIQTNVRSSS